MVNGWVDEIASAVMEHLRGREPVSLQELASAMRVSEALALSYVSILVREGKVVIAGLGVRENWARDSVRED
jgi:hypothetical protein